MTDSLCFMTLIMTFVIIINITISSRSIITTQNIIDPIFDVSIDFNKMQISTEKDYAIVSLYSRTRDFTPEWIVRKAWNKIIFQSYCGQKSGFWNGQIWSQSFTLFSSCVPFHKDVSRRTTKDNDWAYTTGK